MPTVTRRHLLAAAALGATPILLGRLANAWAGVVTDTSKLMDLALAISNSSPKIRAYAIEQARVSISQENALAELDKRLTALEEPVPEPPPPPPPAPTSAYLNDLGDFGRPARDWSVAANWHPDSARLLGILKAAATSLIVPVASYGVAIYRAVATDPTMTVTNLNHWGNRPDGMSFRCPQAAKPALGTDGHMVVVQPDGSLAEMWKATRLSATTWSAGAVSAALAGEWNYPIAGCRGSSFTLPCGIITPEDVKAGAIRHALAAVLPTAAVRRASMLPSNDTDGQQTDGIPEGARAVLDPDPALTSGLTGLTQLVGRAWQTHGWLVVDKTSGSDMSMLALAPESLTALGQPNPWTPLGLTGYVDVKALLALLPQCRIENQPIKVKA